MKKRIHYETLPSEFRLETTDAHKTIMDSLDRLCIFNVLRSKIN